MRVIVTGVVGLEHVPEPIRSLHGLDRVDYADVFTLHTAAATDQSAEQWARAVLEEGQAVRRFAFIPWRVLLGLRLGPSHAPCYVHGWKIAGSDDNWIRLEAASWLITCHAITHIADGQVSVALFVRYDHPIAAVWWPMLSVVHRRAMPIILHQGLQVLTSRPHGTSPTSGGGIAMKLPNSAHTSRPWCIHEFTRDFQVLDVWATSTPGGPDDFPRLVALGRSLDPAQSTSLAVRVLFAVRWALGDLLGLDTPDSGLVSRVPSLRDRMPADLLDTASGPASDALPFRWLYMLNDECAAEIANKTVHGILHAGWVPDGSGAYRGQLAVLVKPNGLLGNAYLAFIKPFRHLLVYPAILSELERRWRTSNGGVDAASPALVGSDWQTPTDPMLSKGSHP